MYLAPEGREGADCAPAMVESPAMPAVMPPMVLMKLRRGVVWLVSGVMGCGSVWLFIVY
jgi:hypothetical protein